jgi:hypothetical protein
MVIVSSSTDLTRDLPWNSGALLFGDIDAILDWNFEGDLENRNRC